MESTPRVGAAIGATEGEAEPLPCLVFGAEVLLPHAVLATQSERGSDSDSDRKNERVENRLARCAIRWQVLGRWAAGKLRRGRLGMVVEGIDVARCVAV